MSFQALLAVRTVKDISATARLVLFGLAQYAGADGLCHPSQQTLADDLGLSERAVRKALGELKDAGVIETARRCRRNGSRTSDQITLLFFTPKEAPEPDARLTRTKAADNRHDMPVAGAVQETADAPVDIVDDGPETRDDNRHDMPVDNRHISSTLPARGAGPTTFESVRGIGQERESDDSLSERARDGHAVCGDGDGDASDPTAVDRALAMWPASGRKRTSRPAVIAAWPEAARRAGGSARLEAAVKACAGDADLAKGDYGWPGLHRWLAEGRYLAFVAEGVGEAVSPNRRTWRGPPEVRAALVAEVGEAAAASYLDPATWDGEARAIRARTGFAARRLRETAGRALKALGVEVREGATHGAA